MFRRITNGTGLPSVPRLVFVGSTLFLHSGLLRSLADRRQTKFWARRSSKYTESTREGRRTLPPIIMAEEAEDPVDSKPEIEENCKPRCVKQLLQYEACVKRVEEDDTGHKHCTGQYFDYWGCIDKCAARKVFDKLK